MTEKKNMMLDIWEVTQTIQKMAVNHVKLLMDQYKTVKGIFGGPNKMLIESVKEFWPQGTEKFFVLLEMWFENQTALFEKNIEESVREYAETVSTLEFSAPNTDHYLMLVGEHTKLWLENYKKLKERREQANEEMVEAMKKLLPMPVHPIIDNANLWMNEQNEMAENAIIERIKNFNFKLNAEKD